MKRKNHRFFFAGRCERYIEEINTNKRGEEMEIIVCLKQVPDTTIVEVDEKTGVLKREGTRTKMNPFDLYALEWGLRLKEQVGGRVRVLSMGPSQAVAVLKEAMSMGADEGYLLSDRAFAGADVLATSYTLAQGIKKMGSYDVILCGKQTTDGDTAQVGPAVAEWLKIPHISQVRDIVPMNDCFRVEADYAEFIQICEIQMPCLLTIEKDSCVPRLPSYLLRKASQNREVTYWNLSDLLPKKNEKVFFGLDGSATQVERIFPPPKKEEQKIFRGTSTEISFEFVRQLQRLKLVENDEGFTYE